MPKRSSGAVASTTQRLSDLGIERFTVRELHRRQLVSAPYNPRRMSDAAKRKLKAGLKRHGLVAPVTWNERTGHVVGGHQRLAQIDALAGTDDFTLSVSVIDVDEAREKELNLLLNNAEAQGEMDLELLGSLFKDPAVEIEGTGFESADLYKLFGGEPFAERTSALNDLAEKVRESQRRYDEIVAKTSKRDSQGFLLVVVFQTPEECSSFLAARGLPDNRYQSGRDLAAAVVKS